MSLDEIAERLHHNLLGPGESHPWRVQRIIIRAALDEAVAEEREACKRIVNGLRSELRAARLVLAAACLSSPNGELRITHAAIASVNLDAVIQRIDDESGCSVGYRIRERT